VKRPSNHLSGCACLSRRGLLGGFAALAGLASANVAFAQEPLCPSTRADIVVRPHLLQPGYDYSLAIADLARISAARAGPKGTLTQHGKKPAGLTTANFESNWLITLGGKRDGRRSCMRPTRIEVDVRIIQHKVYVARDATQVATCRREVVLEHENRHVRINLECIEDAKRRIEQVLSAFVPAMPVMEGENINPQVVGERYKQMLARPVGDAFDGALAVANARHAAMDTNEAYARDWSRCPAGSI
jgi:hypothetical protein